MGQQPPDRGRTRRLLLGNVCGSQHPLRHRGRGCRRSPWEQALQNLLEASVASWTEGQRAARRGVYDALPADSRAAWTGSFSGRSGHTMANPNSGA